MKISEMEQKDIAKNDGPKLRNIHEEKDLIPDEAPEGVDIRIKLGIAAVLALIIFTGIRGTMTKSSLATQLEEQQKQLTAAEAEALLYGITEDEDGELVIPVSEDKTSTVDVSDLEWESIEERNGELLSSFTGLLLNWKGNSGYEKVRQTLISDWKFEEDSLLLSSYMPPLESDLDANMSCSGYSTFLLENDGKNMSYFLICTVRNTIDGTSASGTVGVRITIHEDGTVSNVMAQTLS